VGGYCSAIHTFDSLCEAMISDDIMTPMETESLFGSSTFRLATYVHNPDSFDPTNKCLVATISRGTSPDAQMCLTDEGPQKFLREILWKQCDAIGEWQTQCRSKP